MQHLFFLGLLLLSACTYSQTEGLSLESPILGRMIEVSHYQVGPDSPSLPIVYMTDGQKMLDNGALKKIQELQEAQKIPAAHYVFVSTIDKQSQHDYRNEYFFCNEKYLHFFEEELIPHVESQLHRSFSPKQRSLIGISFGGLNAAYFSAHSDKFQNFGLLSPVTFPCKTLSQTIVLSPRKPQAIFLSSGKNDAEKYVKTLEQLYLSKTKGMKVHYTQGGHNFKNWNGQWELILNHLLATP